MFGSHSRHYVWTVAAAVAGICGLAAVAPGAEPWSTPVVTRGVGVLQQPAAADEYPFIPHAPGRAFVGLSQGRFTCRNCHNAQREGDPIPGVTGEDAGEWILGNEVETWARLDKHYQAYTVLLKERSQQMARILGVVDGEGHSQIHRDVRCLACHSGLPIDRMGAENGLVPVELTQDRRLNLGVSCEGCHGAAGELRATDGWLLAHAEPATWRHMKPEEKWSKHGFYDVRSAASRTRMCASCHIGNARAGRVVTHEMYAAGHPPLPGFEAETFIDQQPPHWRELGMKDEQVRKDFLQKTGTTFDPAELQRTRRLLVGALVNLSEYLKLTADLADQSIEMPVARPEWPELAQFACYACHHELESPAWRQERGFWLVPGRPGPHEWPFTLAEVGARASGQAAAAQLDEQRRMLARPLNAQPFGSSESVPGAARAVARWADSVAQTLEGKVFRPEDGRVLLKELARTASEQALDYDSARQVVWAFNVIYRDLSRRGELTPFSPSEEAIGWFPQRENLDSIARQLAGFDGLLLDLRKGRRTTQIIPGENQPRPLLESDLELVLAPIAAYDPAEFQAQFTRLAELLEQQVVGAR